MSRLEVVVHVVLLGGLLTWSVVMVLRWLTS